MADFSDACRLALRLPDATATENALEIGGKGFAWTYTQIVPKQKGRTVHPDVLAIRTVDLGEKDALIAAEPEKFFTDPHYRSYPAVLARLPLIGDDELFELLENAWRTKAPKKLAATYDAAKAAS